MNKYEILKDGYERLFNELTRLDDGDMLHDLVVEYRSLDGELIRFSWLDRNLLLESEERGMP